MSLQKVSEHPKSVLLRFSMCLFINTIELFDIDRLSVQHLVTHLSSFVGKHVPCSQLCFLFTAATNLPQGFVSHFASADDVENTSDWFDCQKLFQPFEHKHVLSFEQERVLSFEQSRVLSFEQEYVL